MKTTTYDFSKDFKRVFENLTSGHDEGVQFLKVPVRTGKTYSCEQYMIKFLERAENDEDYDLSCLEIQRNETQAVSKYIRMSPSKIRRVLREIQGKTYKEALTILEFMPYASCDPIIKVVKSVGANAKNNLGVKENNLVVKSAFANQGPTMKRFRPRAQGRAYKILKATSHITIILST